MFGIHSDEKAGAGTLFVRYGLGLSGVIAGIVVIIVNPGGFGVEGFGLLEGAGWGVLLLNWIYRLGVSGDREREREEQARRYLEEHGHWPDEPRRPARRPPNAGPRH